MPRITAERLERAGMFISIAPARSFSLRERKLLVDFVTAGGILLCTVGAEQAPVSAPLLAEFGLRVPPSPVPTSGNWREPEPMGHIRSLFLDVKAGDTDVKAGDTRDTRAGVIFYAAWPVEATDSAAEVLVAGRQEQPVVVVNEVGRGKMVLIGDTGFAMNKNLEYIGGEPFDGGYENAYFWRWLITRITGQPEWIPPASAASKGAAGETQSADQPEGEP
jgi:hypothetical protein